MPLYPINAIISEAPRIRSGEITRDRKMAVQLVYSNGELQEARGVIDLVAEHRRAISTVARLGKRFMEANDAEALLIGQRLDIAMTKEAQIRRRVAMVPITSLDDLKIKAAYFKRLMSKDWCELEPADILALLRSFANAST